MIRGFRVPWVIVVQALSRHNKRQKNKKTYEAYFYKLYKGTHHGT